MKKYAVLALMALFFLPLAGLAQEQVQDQDTTESDDVYDLGEIEITATKRKSLLMETPVAVTALTQEKLEREGVKDITDIGAYVPSTQIGFSPSDSGVQVTVRGVTSNNFTELGDPTVGIHVDGIYAPRPQSGLALLHDVERIEVLRGPQGTLFGRNSTSGAINVLTARPQFDEVSGYVEVEYGDYDRMGGRGVLNIPVSDTFGFRAAFMIEERDSYITQVMDEFDFTFDADGDGSTAGPFDVGGDLVPVTDQRRNRPVGDSDAYFNVDRWAARLAGRWSPNWKTDWMVTYERYEDTSAGGLSLKDCEKAAGTFFACEPGRDEFFAAINVPGEMDFTIDSIRSEFSYAITENVLMEHRIGVSTQERFQQYDGDAGAFADPDHPAYGIQNFAGYVVTDLDAITDLGFEPFNLLPWEDLQLTTRFSEYDSLVTELQFKSTSLSDLQWVVGGFYMKEENEIRFDVEIPTCCGVVRPLGQSFIQPDREVESQAVFAQFDYAATDSLTLTFGYRHTWDEKSDLQGSNHETIGYWVNPAMWDPDNTFWHESFGLIGLVDGWGQNGCDGGPCFYQSNNFTDIMGSLSEDFVDRIPGSDNTYDADWDKGTWRLGFDYDINEDWFWYGYVATGFKAGGFGDKVDVCECGELTAFPYDPEEVTTWETGFKARLLDGRLNLLANVFFSEYDDMQRTSWVIVGESVNSGRDIGTLLTTNLAESEITGIEVEWDWIPWQGGRIYGWVTWLDAEITNLPGADDGWFCFERAYMGLTPCPAEDPTQTRPDNSPRRPTDFSGNNLPWSPEWSTTITMEHTWWLSDDFRLSPFVTVHWQDDMYFNDGNFDEGPFHSGQEAFTTANASLRLINERQAWALEAYVYNLTDELARSWSDPGPGYLRANFYEPRMWGLKFRKDF